jgi:hypothetical protein
MRSFGRRPKLASVANPDSSRQRPCDMGNEFPRDLDRRLGLRLAAPIPPVDDFVSTAHVLFKAWPERPLLDCVAGERYVDSKEALVPKIEALEEIHDWLGNLCALPLPAEPVPKRELSGELTRGLGAHHCRIEVAIAKKALCRCEKHLVRKLLVLKDQIDWQRLGTYWAPQPIQFQSGRRDLNSGPLVPQTSALTRLRHAP